MLEFLSFTETGTWVLVSFVLFIALAYKKGKQSILSGLDSKIEKIKSDLDAAEKLRIEAQEILAKYQRQHREADKEAKTLVKSAEKQAALIKEKILLEFEETQKNREIWLKQRVKRMEEDALSEIKAEVSDLSSRATQEILITEVDQKAHDLMVDETIKSLAKSVA
ncbi:MAG: hypothetical protein JKY11_09110 [Alphaproteobacteria bacterium]|nr:hypothetical protein [Alphaproteobacteria bacterium]